MKRKQRKPNGWQRVLMAVQTGEVFSKEQLKEILKDKKIHMYRMSNYMLDIKLFAGGIVKAHKDGRKVTAYQITNPEVVQQYLRDKGFIEQKKVTKKQKLADIAQPVEQVIEVTDEQTKTVTQ